jgi:cytochrome c oxidase assembly factor CtaG
MPARVSAAMRRCTIAMAGALVAGLARAHGDGDGEAAGWSFEAWVVVPLAISLVWYTTGAWRLRHRGAQPAATRRRMVAFYTGWTVLALALMSPLHAAGARSFAAHMLEHELLMLVAAPLLVLSAPVGVALWALPGPWRRALGSLGHQPLWLATWGACAGLLGATVLQALALWLWHAPALFELALAHRGWHVAQHACFMVGALLFWHAAWRQRGQAGPVVLALFFTSTVSGALGAFMAFARSPWYAAYAALGLTPSGLTPLEDQQLAGLLMWVPGGMVHALAALWILARALRRSPETGVRHAP